jgi:hypothetical protein
MRAQQRLIRLFPTDSARPHPTTSGAHRPSPLGRPPRPPARRLLPDHRPLALSAPCTPPNAVPGGPSAHGCPRRRRTSLKPSAGACLHENRLLPPLPPAESTASPPGRARTPAAPDQAEACKTPRVVSATGVASVSGRPEPMWARRRVVRDAPRACWSTTRHGQEHTNTPQVASP